MKHSGNTRQRQCVGREMHGNTRQRQCLTSARAGRRLALLLVGMSSLWLPYQLFDQHALRVGEDSPAFAPAGPALLFLLFLLVVRRILDLIDFVQLPFFSCPSCSSSFSFSSCCSCSFCPCSSCPCSSCSCSSTAAAFSNLSSSYHSHASPCSCCCSCSCSVSSSSFGNILSQRIQRRFGQVNRVGRLRRRESSAA